MEKEEQILRNRIQELATLCERRDIPAHTDFLNLNEQTIFYAISGSLPPVRYEVTGGYELAERRVVCFLPSYEEVLSEPPFVCLKISPSNRKFAEPLTHRDYLGAMMSLGIERGMTGDIVTWDGDAKLFVMKHISAYLIENLTSIRHTNVTVSLCEEGITEAERSFSEISGSVSSLRLDSLVAMAGHLSRSKAVPYIESEKVFVNGKLNTSVSSQLKEGDVLSIRGIGKFRFCGIEGQTKKGRYYVTMEQYQ